MNGRKQLFIYITLLLPVIQISAQDTISGVINYYAEAEEVILCHSQIIVDELGPIQANDTLLLIQMQGADVNTSNSDDFGRIQSLNGAGLFEAVVVDTVLGDTLQLSHRWTNDYDVDGGLQLVRIPSYENAIVEGTLEAQKWDGQTGGVLALFARRLRLEADVDVSGDGFRGGSAVLNYDGTCSWLINHDNYRYGAGSIRSGEKGEGVAGIPLQWPRGRGPLANGGGGGNDHNSGGGGGAQVTDAGRGGRNNNPNPLGCQGRNPGLGGRALAPLRDRLFLGGGGGAGHGNNDVATDGGDGGGIVIIVADALESNGFIIRANGQDASDSEGDGAGGGGAGGTILLDVSSFTDGLTVEAHGGCGGNADNNNSTQCFGPGGGGSGGRILGNIPNTAIRSIQGGENGITLNSFECANGPNGALPGRNGNIEAPIQLNFSSQPAIKQLVADFDFTVDGLTVTFINRSNAPHYEWSFGDGNSSQEINPVHNYGQPGTYRVTLFAIDPICGDTAVFIRNVNIELLPVADASFSAKEGCPPVAVEFRNNSLNADSVAWIFEGGRPNRSSLNNPEVVYDQAGSYSVELRAFNGFAIDTLIFNDTIRVLAPPSANFLIDTNGLELTTQNFSVGDEYLWLFGDGNRSTDFQPTHFYSQVGSYEVLLIARNDCGTDTARVNIQIGDPPVADFTIESLSGVCAPVFLELRNASTGAFDSLRWELPGATPSSSNEASPGVVYTKAGSYDIRLTLFHPFGTTERLLEDAVILPEGPLADFEYEVNGRSVRFASLSLNVNDSFWDFGDGESSNQENPVHTYASEGAYDVTLIVSNSACVDSLTARIFIDSMPEEDSLRVFIPDAFSPNDDGINDYFTIYSNELQLIESLVIFDRWGNRLFRKENFPPNQDNLGWDGSANGKLLDPGVYVFLAKIVFLNGEKKQVQGSVTLMK